MSVARTIQALLLALRDLPQPSVLRLLAQSVVLTLLFFLAAGGSLYFLARWALSRWHWLDGMALDLAGLLIAVLLIFGSWLLFRAVAILVIGLLADTLVADVERRHYPHAAIRAVDVGWRRNMTLALASLARLIGGNLLALPFYILLIVTGIGTPLLALFVNAGLLGRDLEAMILARHPGEPRLSGTRRWSLGLLSAAAFLIPVANLLAPLVSAAMAVHLIHLRDPGRSARTKDRA